MGLLEKMSHEEINEDLFEGEEYFQDEVGDILKEARINIKNYKELTFDMRLKIIELALVRETNMNLHMCCDKISDAIDRLSPKL